MTQIFTLLLTVIFTVLTFVSAPLPAHAGYLLKESCPVDDSGAICRLGEKVAPSVVRVESYEYEKGEDDETEKITSSGSGFFLKEHPGLVVTNNHVVENTAGVKVELTVDFDTRLIAKAEVLGTNPLADVALLKVHIKDPPEGLTFASASPPGIPVLTVGFPKGIHKALIAEGIVTVSQSETGELLNDGWKATVLMTDAAINHGNSGGPLVNYDGEVLGINSAIFTKAVCMGIVVRFDEVQRDIAELLANQE